MFDFLSEKLSSVFSRLTGQRHLTEKNIEEVIQKIYDALLDADVPLNVAETFVSSVKTDVIGQKVLASMKPAEQLVKVVHERLLKFLGQAYDANQLLSTPGVVMVMGLQGSGKTTTMAKLAYLAKKQESTKKHKVLLASVDFYRPAAIDQLEILAGSAGIPFYRSSCKDVEEAARDIYQQYTHNNYDLLLLDTAGRLHVQSDMLAELQALELILKPVYKVLVIDAMTGQESLRIAQAFNQSIGFQGAILTKMDSDTRAGTAFSFRYMLNKPILFVGTGERLDDLEHFKVDRAATRILGMGDLHTLLEKAEEKIKVADQERMYNTLMSGRMTLQDFADQMSMVGKLGSLSTLMKYMPGMGNLSLTPDMIEKGEQELKKFRAIMSSMTLKERLDPSILNGSRKERIARGAGVKTADVNGLLQRFEQTQQFAKLFKRFGRF